MKQSGSMLRLSPNEEARVIQEERERRRKLRIQQVREQQRYIARQIRREVLQKRQQELQVLEEDLRHQWEEQQREKVQTLQRLYQESLQLLGQAHRSAKENEPDLAAIAQQKKENHFKAEERHREALRELKSQRLKDHKLQNATIDARKKALQVEKERSAKVASLPPPPPNPIQDIDTKRPRVVRRSDLSAYSGTHYHMPESAVDRELDTLQPNANDEAELEARRRLDLQREENRRREEQLEKARLRGIEALRREQLVQDRERLLVELEHMQQTDLLRRRQQVTQMPPQIFQPLYQRKDAREDFQREMEFAFEDMYTGERRIKGDMVVRLEPEPLPALSVGSQDQALDVTLDDNSVPETENTLQVSEQEVNSTEQETFAEVNPSRPAPRQALRRLLDRIRSQRNQWTDQSQDIPTADSPPATTHHVPEPESSIETGSLVSQQEKQSPIECPEIVTSPPVATMNPSAVLETPDVLARRIQEFEEDRQEREEQLEKEKQQQVLLLKDLEEQKALLELMLLEAQQEREKLKAAVSQEAPSEQEEDPAEEEEVGSVLQAELVPPPGEEDHTRRVKEYQQRLLEQNRLHQRSVEVARQRLEDYQRALRIRYITAGSSQPPYLPPGLVHPPPPTTHSAHLLPPFLAPVTPAHVHRERLTPEQDTSKVSEGLASAAHLSQEGSLLDNSNLTAFLTDSIMERVTEHLPERLRPSSVTTEMERPSTTPHLPKVPAHTDLQPLQDVSPLIPQHDIHDIPMESSLHTSLLRSRVDIERQRQALEEIQRRRSQQREAAMLQQMQEEEERRRLEMERQKQIETEERQMQESELERIRKQKERLQALINMDAQLSEPVSEPSSDSFPSENMGQNRAQLLASLLKTIEEAHGGTLSHLEESPQKEDSPPELLSLSPEPVAQSGGPPPFPPTHAFLLRPPQAVKPPVSRVRLGFSEMTRQHELSAIPEVETPLNRSQLTGLEGSLRLQPSLTAAGLEDSRSSVVEEKAASSGKSSERLSPQPCRERLLKEARTQSPDCSTERNDSFLRILSPLSSDSGRGADVSGAVITNCRSFTESPLRPPETDSFSSTTISTGSYITTDPEHIPVSDKSTSPQQCTEERNEAGLYEVSSILASDLSTHGDSTAEPPDAAIDSVFSDSRIQHIIDKYTRELNISLNAAGKTTGSEGSLLDELDSSVSQPSLIRVSGSREEEEEETAADSQCRQTETGEAQRNDPDVDTPTTLRLKCSSGDDKSLVQTHEDSFHPLIGQLVDQSSYLIADHRDSALEQLVGQPSAHSSIISPPPDPQADWNSTLRRMMGGLSHQSGFDWSSGGQESYKAQPAGSVTSESSSVIWVRDAEEEESRMMPLVGEPDESAGQITGSSGEQSHLALTATSTPRFPPQTSPHSTPDLIVNPQHEVIGVEQQDSPRAGGSDSFHPLMAEVTHNETVDPSMTFHHPGHFPEVHHASAGTPVSTFPPSEDSEPSPEQLRAAQPELLHQSNLSLVDVEQTVVNLTDMTVHHDCHVPSTSPLGGNTDSELRFHDSLSCRISEAAREKGILEQSEITLASLTDTTLQDQETLVTEEEEEEKDVQEHGNKSSEYSSLPEDCGKTHPAINFEFQWGPNTDNKDQQKLKALLQRSDRRVKELKARRAQSQTQPDGKTQPAIWKPPTSSEPHSQTSSRLKDRQERPAPSQQRKTQCNPPVRDSALKEVVEVKICTTEQRRQNLVQMHQRTQRLYEQLEEVKQQKATRSRQEDYANNRLKAKEFHKKTLQKLRAKQTRESLNK